MSAGRASGSAQRRWAVLQDAPVPPHHHVRGCASQQPPAAPLAAHPLARRARQQRGQLGGGRAGEAQGGAQLTEKQARNALSALARRCGLAAQRTCCARRVRQPAVVASCAALRKQTRARGAEGWTATPTPRLSSSRAAPLPSSEASTSHPVTAPHSSRSAVSQNTRPQAVHTTAPPACSSSSSCSQPQRGHDSACAWPRGVAMGRNRAGHDGSGPTAAPLLFSTLMECRAGAAQRGRA